MSSFDPLVSPDHGQETEAVVKWFSLAKGFGFVAPMDGSPDAFLHSSTVSSMGMRDLPEGTKLLVEVADGPKGRQIVKILQVLGVAEVPRTSGMGGGMGGLSGGGRPAPTGPETEVAGTVKWFKPDKGFGFVTPDDGDRDIFVHRSILLRAGLAGLESGQRVKMKVQSAAKGREATSIEIV